MARGAHVRKRVLIVDNDLTISRVVVRILAEEVETHTCTDAREASALVLGGATFDVILCDMLMPRLSGPEFYRIVLAADPRAASRMVFMTGGASLPEVQAFLSSVPNLVLAKPFTRVALRDAVRTVGAGDTVKK
jgi:CheY-like chemotaxis protein